MNPTCTKCGQATLDESGKRFLLCMNEECAASYVLQKKPWREVIPSTPKEEPADKTLMLAVTNTT